VRGKVKMKKLVLLAFLPFLAQVASASVDSSFSGTNDPVLVPPFPAGSFTFTFTSPSFITSDLNFIVQGPTLTCSDCDAVSILPSHPGATFDSLQIGYQFAGIGQSEFYFPPEALDVPGVYTASSLTANPGTLTVTTTTPEPTYAVLLIVGLGALFVARTRRHVAI